MKKYLIGIIGLLTVALCLTVSSRSRLNAEYERAVGNLKAVEGKAATSDMMSRSLQLKISQLEYFQDSIIQKMDSVRKSLKIKDKDVKSMQYIQSVVTKTDTMVLRDTVFKDPHFTLDSIIGDKWYKSRVHMRYPNLITLSPEFTSKKHVIISSKKETVDPPKKFFLLRWFQKKHTVIKVDVVEESPYVTDSISRFIEIVK